MLQSVIFDTNILLDDPDILRRFKEDGYIIIMPTAILEEVDGLKNNESVGHKAREVNRILEELSSSIYFEVRDIYDNMPSGWDIDKRDNKIVMCAKNHKSVLYSDDFNVRIKAKSLGVNVVGKYTKSYEDDYLGYKYVVLDHQQQSDFYSGIYELEEDFYINEYIILKDKDTDKIIDKFKMTSGGIEHVKYNTINSKHLGKVKPRNLQQELTFDMLQSNIRVAVLTGGFGVGKDFQMIAHALNMIETGRYDKLIWVRNTIEVKNSKPIGFLKGDMKDKLLPYAMILADHLGGKDGLDMFIESGKIELEHLGFIRGRDIKNSILYCSEAENMTKEHIQLLLGRIGEGSMLMINGDYKQTDERVFEYNNGLNRIIEKLKGEELFGYVKLDKVERSDVARLADKLD